MPIEYFIGRVREVKRLRGMVKASTQGKFRIGFVSGERGIGKSSLASFVRHLSEHENQVAGCHVFLGGVQDLKEMLRRTFDRLLKESMDKPWHEQIKEFFGNHVRKVGLFGITLELNLQDSDLSTLANDFVPTVTRLLDSLKGHKSTLFLILDDINGLAGSEVFANWLKSTVDEISTSQRKMPLCILVVGLEERRQELVSKQPSLARVFELIDIAPWSDDEAMRSSTGTRSTPWARRSPRRTYTNSSGSPADFLFWHTRSATRSGARPEVWKSIQKKCGKAS